MHFVWDAPGRARHLVRAGFLLLLLAGALLCAARLVHAPAFDAVARGTLTAALLVYGLGQAAALAARTLLPRRR